MLSQGDVLEPRATQKTPFEDAAQTAPPLANRGVELTKPTFHIDWVSITVRTADLSGVAVGLINALYPGVVEGYSRRNRSTWNEVGELHPYGIRGYREVWTLPLGVRIYARPHNMQHGDHLHFEIPGTAVTAAGLKRLAGLYNYLDGYFSAEWQHTRLDLAFDHVPFTPAIARAAWDAENVRTRARRESWGWFSNAEGDTFIVGSRASDRYLRIYDKRGYTRCELELKGERSSTIGRQFADLVADGLQAIDQAPALALSHLRDFIDFTDRLADENPTRAPLLDWWQAFVDGAERAGLVLSQVVKTMQKAANWIAGAVAPTLAAWLHHTGGDFDQLLEIIERGKERWGASHRAMLASAGTPAD